MKKLKGQILIITLLVLTILSILTVSLVLLNSRDVSQVVNNELYEKIYNSSETKLKEVLGLMADPNVPLGTLSTQYGTLCITNAAAQSVQCNFKLCPDDDVTCNPNTAQLAYEAKIGVSNEKNIIDFPLDKDRPLSINLNGYASGLRVTINKYVALDFTLIYEQGGVQKSYSAVYDPNAGTPSGVYNSVDPVFRGYIGLVSGNPLAITLTYPAAYRNFKLLSITPRSKTASDSILISVVPMNAPSYPEQVRSFTSEAFSKNDPDSPSVKIVSQIPLEPQMYGLLDYALITQDVVEVGD